VLASAVAPATKPLDAITHLARSVASAVKPKAGAAAAVVAALAAAVVAALAAAAANYIIL
jgi:hypothetical protein